MSFLYPRKIAVTRPGTSTSVGKGSYEELTTANETAVIGSVTYAAGTSTFSGLVGIPANIDKDTSDRQISGVLPASARRMEFRITIPPAFAGLGKISERDVVTDDLGKRYQVSAATWGPLGYNLRASLLEN